MYNQKVNCRHHKWGGVRSLTTGSESKKGDVISLNLPGLTKTHGGTQDENRMKGETFW